MIKTAALTLQDKKVVDAFLDQKHADGKILVTDGTVLKTVGFPGGSTKLARWQDDKIKLNHEYSSRTEQSIVRYVEKTAPRRWIASTRDLRSTVQSLVKEYMQQFDAWFDSDMYGDYRQQYNSLVKTLSAEIADTIQWAEQSGTGDVTGFEVGHVFDLAELLFKLAPSGVSKFKIQHDLEDMVDEIFQTGDL